MPFSRPSVIPYPQVWHRFEINKNERNLKFRVQDLTEEYFEKSIELLLRHFTADEPPCKHIEVKKHPSALKELENLWRNTLKDRLSVICFEEPSEQIAGLNVLTVACEEDVEEPFQTEDKIWAKLFGAVDLVSKSVNVFSHYGVDKYLTAYGLVVMPEFRGMHIGKEILKARLPGRHC